MLAISYTMAGNSVTFPYEVESPRLVPSPRDTIEATLGEVSEKPHITSFTELMNLYHPLTEGKESNKALWYIGELLVQIFKVSSTSSQYTFQFCDFMYLNDIFNV